MWKDSETEIDFLDYDYLIKILKDIVSNDKLLPASIGVYGDWGSGKSSLMYMCKKSLEAEDPNVMCLVFNGWLFESYEDAKSAILGSILDEIGKKKRISKKAKETLKGLYESIDKFKLVKNSLKLGADILFNGGIGKITDITINKILGQVPINVVEINPDNICQAVADELNNKELRENIRKYQQKFAKLLSETKISRLVVFIDELDRCRPDTILDTLEVIKLFLFYGKVAFVVGADERHISYAVKSKFKDIEGIQISIGQEYLEKLIQYPIRIPRLNTNEVEIYIACLLLQSELQPDIFTEFVNLINDDKKTDFEKFNIKAVGDRFSTDKMLQSTITDCLAVAKQLSSVLSSGLHGNPRQCKRFLNSLDMRIRMATYKNKSLDRKILAKIMMLEYIKPKLFNDIAIMAHNNTLGKELKILENESSDDGLKELKIWKDDAWFADWCKISPALADTDLKLYFYFTRTSLDEKISKISSVLSPDAQELLENLLSKSDIIVNKAMKESKNISYSEAATILEAMFTTLSAETTISKEHIVAFLTFSESRPELHVDAIGYLKSFTGTQISLAAVAYIVDFAEKSNKKAAIKEIADNWGKTRPELQKAIEKYSQ